MKFFVLIFSSISGAIGILLGAFASHILVKLLPQEKLASFEIGVRYQMYHALALLCLGGLLDYKKSIEKYSAYCMISGMLFFSGSLYVLSLGNLLQTEEMKILLFITPLGGLLLFVGWLLMAFHFTRLARSSN